LISTIMIFFCMDFSVSNFSDSINSGFILAYSRVELTLPLRLMP
jgi:hypothetical protein